jgi:hypothetical protein
MKKLIPFAALLVLTWVGAAAISYGVVELTAGGPRGEQGIQGPQGKAGVAGQNLDSTPCHQTLLDMLLLTLQVERGEISGSVLEQRVDEVLTQFRSQC